MLELSRSWPKDRETGPMFMHEAAQPCELSFFSVAFLCLLTRESKAHLTAGTHYPAASYSLGHAVSLQHNCVPVPATLLASSRS